jgi:hypothetical protein
MTAEFIGQGSQVIQGLQINRVAVEVVVVAFDYSEGHFVAPLFSLHSYYSLFDAYFL